MYVCGPTVYDRSHLGNARPALVFDVLYRLLRHVYGENSVTYARNFTDVDDRINETARDRKAAGASGTIKELIRQRSEETIRWYQEDMNELCILRPDHEPRATEYIAEMISMIENIIAKGHAYEVEGHVLFSVDNWREEYGVLSGRTADEMIAGARVEVAPYKKNPMDFVLWKPSTEDLPGWDSPWGCGRPGWHIECSAMSHKLLGGSFDIHGGGADLLFPHHENELAQSRCAWPDQEFARVWLHNEMLLVDGKKMSKSLGNFFTVRDILDQGVPGEVIRFVMLSTHYRKPMDWTDKKRKDASKRLAGWFRRTDGVSPASGAPEQVVAALADDLNIHLAMTEMEKLEAGDLKAAMRLIGLPDAESIQWFRLSGDNVAGIESSCGHDVNQPALRELMDIWQMLREKKDYGAADRLKERIEAAGVKLTAGRDGPRAELTPDFDPAKLEDLT